MITKRFICVAVNTSLCVSTLALSACNKQPAQAAVAPTAAAAPVSAGAAAPSYTPPSADQLYQLVAPIALFPDNLVAQVLAGATYPDQITAADQMVGQNPGLKGEALQNAVNPEPWDASVKGLTAFPSVLDQMSKNIVWTTALGQAYANDPSDVMNAIQVMRQRASQHGTLKSTPQQTVITQPIAAVPPDPNAIGAGCTPASAVATVVQAPAQTIEIQPAQPGVVYVPTYDPQTVYGEEVAYYPGYTYVAPGYGYGGVVVAGVIGFGTGILVANLFEHHGWGWNNWGMRWGGYGRGGWLGPAVVHDNSVYVSRSTTVLNNRYANTRFVNNSQANNFRAFGAGAANPQARAAVAERGTMTMPNFRNAATRGAGPQAFEHAQTARAGAAQATERFNPAAEAPRARSEQTRFAEPAAAREQGFARPAETRAEPARQQAASGRRTESRGGGSSHGREHEH